MHDVVTSIQLYQMEDLNPNRDDENGDHGMSTMLSMNMKKLSKILAQLGLMQCNNYNFDYLAIQQRHFVKFELDIANGFFAT